MAVYKIFPQKDATIYSEVLDMNTGRDEILELASYSIGEKNYVKRALIQFNSTEISDVLSTYVGTEASSATNYTASLRLYLASANELPTEYTVLAHPVSTTWTEGNGKYGDIPRNSSGVSWKYVNYSGSAEWGTTTNVTMSYSGSDTGGGAWYYLIAGYNATGSQYHGTDSTHDLEIDVTDIIKAQQASAVANNGFILKLTGSLEFNAYQQQRQLYLRYFSGNTHTIYPPCLEIKWYTNSYSTGSLTYVSDPNCVVQISNNKGTYANQGRQKLQLKVRPKYPTRTFVTSSNYITNYLLPADSHWGLRDENTQEMVIDFDPVSNKLNADSNGNFFYLHMGGLEPERYYRVLLKATIDGSTTVIDQDQVFKVVRNG